MFTKTATFVFRLFSILILLTLLVGALGITPVRAAGIFYVTPSGTGNCSSWADACILQTALTGAGSGDEIWVAAGVYKPTTDPANRVANFHLKSGLAAYGGFTGTETIRDQRNPAINITILSGDIDNNDSQTPIIADLTTVTGNTTNSYHVVVGAANATLDGFTITAGNANDSASPNNAGSGMYNYSSDSLALTNITFSGNGAGFGGGMLNAFSSPTLTYVTFNGNAATSSGGGMLNYSSSPVLTNVTFSNNSAGWGGGIYNESGSSPTLTNVTFSSNGADYGGGMENNGSNPMLTSVTFDGNTATSSGGGMLNYSSSPTLMNVTYSDNSAGWGGGMYNESGSSPTLTNSTLSGNSATWGGGIYNFSGALTVTNSTLLENTAGNIDVIGGGGGIYNDTSGNVTLMNSTLSGNSAAYGGGIENTGTLTVTNSSTLSGNSAHSKGGGIYNTTSGNATVTNSSLLGNDAPFEGGGIYNEGGLTVTDSTLSENSAWNSNGNGGGIDNWYGTLTVTNSTLSGNSALNDGGGIYNYHANITMRNSTLSGNSAHGGGGIYSEQSVVAVTNNTLTGNSAYAGGGIFTYLSTLTVTSSTLSGNSSGLRAISGTLNFANTIIAHSTSAVDCVADTIATNVNNLVQDGSCSAGGINFKSGNPLLVALADNGGPTWTMALQADSPARDAGDDATCAAPPVNNLDQRGITRPQGAHCDIGAYEFVSTPPPGAFDKSAPANGATGISTSPTFSWAASSGVTSYEYCYDTSNDNTCSSWINNGTSTSKALSGLTPGTTYYWHVRANNTGGTTYSNGSSTAFWSFTTVVAAPGAFDKSAPASGTTGVSTSPTLLWTVSSGAASYEYCYDTSNDATCNNVWTSTGTNTSVGLSSLGTNTTYYWQVRALNAGDTTYANDGTWWSFTTIPNAPAAFNKSAPVNGATNQSTSPTIIWDTSANASSYDYCYDTLNNTICDSSWISTGMTTSVGLIGLNIATTYYWQVRATNTGGTVYANSGTWWSFTTGSDGIPPTVIDIIRLDPTPTAATSVRFNVLFSEPVAGVDMIGPAFDDFTLMATSGISGAFVTDVSGSGTTYAVTANTGSGNGTLRLDVKTGGSIVDAALNPLAAGFTTGQVYSIIKTATFIDVPLSYWANGFIERLYNAGVTGGCSTNPLMFCPETVVTRAQMAVFLLRGEHGSTYTPPTAVGNVFGDVPASYWAAAWIEALAAEGVTGGCGNGNYCPGIVVTRAQMAVFLLRAEHGNTYIPPTATGVFADVPTTHWAAAWIEQLAAEGITGGCGSGNYCPETPVTRAQMAVFLVGTFNLP
jgi:hypothetical protein